MVKLELVMEIPLQVKEERCFDAPQHLLLKMEESELLERVDLYMDFQVDTEFPVSLEDHELDRKETCKDCGKKFKSLNGHIARSKCTGSQQDDSDFVAVRKRGDYWQSSIIDGKRGIKRSKASKEVGSISKGIEEDEDQLFREEEDGTEGSNVEENEGEEVNAKEGEREEEREGGGKDKDERGGGEKGNDDGDGERKKEIQDGQEGEDETYYPGSCWPRLTLDRLETFPFLPGGQPQLEAQKKTILKRKLEEVTEEKRGLITLLHNSVGNLLKK